MKTVMIVFIVFLIVGMVYAQDEDIALEWRIERDNLVCDLIHSWLRGNQPGMWSPAILKIIRVSINLSAITREPDPFLLVQNPKCMPAAYLEVWLSQHGISLRSESMFEGKSFQLVIPQPVESDSLQSPDSSMVSIYDF